MRKIRVCVYGGPYLDEKASAFVSALAYEVLARMDAVIVTGGFLHKASDNDNSTSTDYAALEGARRYCNASKTDLSRCYEAVLPTLDSGDEAGTKIRMTEALGITVTRVAGTTPLGRRLAMINGVDLVVTIAGKRHTEVIGEQALELGTPFLPIPNANGDSGELLVAHRERIAARFAPGALDTCLDRVDASFEDDPRVAARAVVVLLQAAKVGRCLILLPYDAEHDALYRSTIEPAVSAHMFPLRLDRLPKSDAIYSTFARAIDDAAAVIVDVTALNENVMYEVGFAHGRGRSPLLFTQDASRLENLPVYFKTLNVLLAADDAQLAALIVQHLTEIKAARTVHQR
jgi:hypothetical protein